MIGKAARNPGLWILMILLAGLACGKGPSTQSRPLPPAIAQLKDQSGGETILRAMEAHGGWWAWKEKETVEYDFDWTPYTGDGGIDSRISSGGSNRSAFRTVLNFRLRIST